MHSLLYHSHTYTYTHSYHRRKAHRSANGPLRPICKSQKEAHIVEKNMANITKKNWYLTFANWNSLVVNTKTKNLRRIYQFKKSHKASSKCHCKTVQVNYSTLDVNHWRVFWCYHRRFWSSSLKSRSQIKVHKYHVLWIIFDEIWLRASAKQNIPWTCQNWRVVIKK